MRYPSCLISFFASLLLFHGITRTRPNPPPDIVEVNVLGVAVPGNAGDGCACMAALVLSDQADRGRVLKELLKQVRTAMQLGGAFGPPVLAFTATACCFCCCFFQAKAQLPSYAVPLFVRIQPVSEVELWCGVVGWCCCWVGVCGSNPTDACSIDLSPTYHI